MGERRYGRVTVEGWVEDTPSYQALYPGLRVVQRVADGEIWVATLHSKYRGMVEFLPEPVTFKDGDALQFSKRKGGDGSVVVRENGVWHCTYEGHRVHDDSYVRESLAGGIAVRLVPEGATGG